MTSQLLSCVRADQNNSLDFYFPIHSNRENVTAREMSSARPSKGERNAFQFAFCVAWNVFAESQQPVRDAHALPTPSTTVWAVNKLFIHNIYRYELGGEFLNLFYAEGNSPQRKAIWKLNFPRFSIEQVIERAKSKKEFERIWISWKTSPNVQWIRFES